MAKVSTLTLAKVEVLLNNGVHIGNGPPFAEGYEGDVYFNPVTKDIWTYTNNHWAIDNEGQEATGGVWLPVVVKGPSGNKSTIYVYTKTGPIIIA